MKILILGATGKMGTALRKVYEGENVVGLSSKDFDVLEHDDELVEHLIRKAFRRHDREVMPDVVFNCAAMLGIDPCEDDPVSAFIINALYPRHLAKASKSLGFTLVHFSTDAVFSDSDIPATENRTPRPSNVYGATKYAGDCLVLAENPEALVVRVPLLFGASNSKPQFFEKMIAAGLRDKRIRVACDILCATAWSNDAARRVKELVEDGEDGVHHVTNDGWASLWTFMGHIGDRLGFAVDAASFEEFPHIGRKNTRVLLDSSDANPLDHWQDAMDNYLQENYLND